MVKFDHISSVFVTSQKHNCQHGNKDNQKPFVFFCFRCSIPLNKERSFFKPLIILELCLSPPILEILLFVWKTIHLQQTVGSLNLPSPVNCKLY
jgi:hypothetical protein